MKKMLLIIFFSCGIVWMLLNYLYWKKLNPQHFVKSAQEVKQIIEALENN